MYEKSELTHIGVVESGDEKEAKIRVLPEFCAGLKGVHEFSHLIILYWIHSRDTAAERRTLRVIPRRHALKVEVGVFACRSPTRPNPIGLCVVKLMKIKNCVLTVKGLDAFKGSPIIDIKPYLPRGDSIPNARVPMWTLHGPQT